MIQDVDSDVLYVQRFSDYMINVSATYIINVSMSRIGRLKIRFKLKDRRCFLRKSFDRWSGGTSIFFSDNNLYKVGIPAQRVLRSLRPQWRYLIGNFCTSKNAEKSFKICYGWSGQKTFEAMLRPVCSRNFWSQICADTDTQTGFTII